MKGNHKIWKPIYSINSEIARSLMEIEAVKAVLENTYFPPSIEADLRQKARVRSTHYSTRIEGNKLTLKEAEQVIKKKKTKFYGRNRDVKEVRNYWDALIKVEEWTSKKTELTENSIKRLHAIVEKGKNAKPTPYRDGQNAIRDSVSGALVYLPPESKDVSKLMGGMIEWIKNAEKEHLPVPIIAALLHYQFVTIHPYYDGNGRVARLLATFILQRGGYGLNGFFSMEEYHARDLEAYYKFLSVHRHHNYYEGRAKADLTPWLSYFICLLSKVFAIAKNEAMSLAKKDAKQEPDELRKLDRRARMVFALFAKQNRVTAADASLVLGLTSRMAGNLLRKWIADGWLEIVDKSNKSRAYGLSEIYRKFIGNK